MPGVGATPPAARSAEEPLTRPPQWFDTLEERTNGEVVGERLLVLPAGHPDLLPVGSVQPGVVPHNRPGREGLACLGRADRWALILAHQASLQPCATPLEVGSDSHKPNVERVVSQIANRGGRRLKLRYRGPPKTHACLTRRTAGLNLRNLIG